MGVKKKSIVMAALLSSCLGLALAADSLAKYEEPNYKVTLKEGDFEVRDYPEVVSASVVVSGRGKDSANQAFKILAGYIFGKNEGQAKVAMTVPVTESIRSEKIAMTVPVTTKEAKDEMTMSFFMPSKYTMETLPKPLDSRITFSTVPARKFAVVRFSGTAGEKSCQKEEQRLRGWLQEKNMSAVSDAVRAFYNPPWTLPFMRRNEIWIEL